MGTSSSTMASRRRSVNTPISLNQGLNEETTHRNPTEASIKASSSTTQSPSTLPPLPPPVPPPPPPPPPPPVPAPPPSSLPSKNTPPKNENLDSGILNLTSLKGQLNSKGDEKQSVQQGEENLPLSIEDWKQRFKELKLPDHDVQSALKIVTENQKTVGAYLEDCYQCIASMKGNITYLENLSVVFFEVKAEQRFPLGEFLVYLKFPTMSLSQYKDALQKYGLKHFNDTTAISTGKEMDDTTIQTIYLIRSHWWNFSDASTLFCASLIANGILQEMVIDMQNVASASETNLKSSFTFESGIGVLHNVSKLSNQRQVYRDLKVVDILGPFLNYTNLPKVTMLVLLTLSNIIDENQTDLLFSHGACFDLLLHIAKRAWKMADLRYDGFSLEELLQGMLGLSKNDKVKSILVEKGVLELVNNILNHGKEREQLVATKLLWELSFDPENKNKIKGENSLMDAVKSLSTCGIGKICRAAQGVLWVIDMGGPKKKKKKTSASVPDKSDSGGHVMISYNWGDQKRLIEVKDSLKDNGYTVWMDIENIKGSTLQAMAEAVEKSVVVLVCMSENYKESPNCRAEAEYAFYLKKPIIPLVMQRQYKPDGWLGILLGTKLFFDFSGKYEFNNKIAELMRELGNLGKGNRNESKIDDIDGPIIKQIVPVFSKVPKPEVKLDVMEWIKENNLTNVACLRNLKPEHLFFLKRLSTRAPEQYYKLILDFLQGLVTVENLDILMTVTDAIEKLPRT